MSWLWDTHETCQSGLDLVIPGWNQKAHFFDWFAPSISLEDASVRYAVVFNGETQLGDDPDISQEPDEERDEDANAPKLKYIIVKALKQDPLLPLDIQTLSFETGEHHLCVGLKNFWLMRLKLNV